MTGPADTILFGFFILAVFLLLLGGCVFGVWLTRIPDSVSPYSRRPMRKGVDLSYDSKVKVLRFLYDMHQYDNRIFEFRHSAVCRETGRIFSNCITWYGAIKLDWSFLQKRYPGKYVSWGSLTPEQQEIVKASHDTLAGFQTEFSSPAPQPKAIEAKYAYSKPGPLYVDVENYVLLGWMQVPDTDLEVLIVQRPVHIITLGSSSYV